MSDANMLQPKRANIAIALPYPFQIILNINFSSRTSSLDVQRTLEAAVEKRTKDTYGPPMGKKIACFIDDMNMPQVDE